ncbi:MAG: RNA 2',3'-cyclic phosphodiesterase [Planctomycetes bacterium]|nr:RNA 2',3'-cyclic phosphodiesterase [Planctomycetota bacterium]
MRCFVALDLPKPVCNYLAGLAASLRGKGDVKWVPAHQLHLTLLFAGELEDDSVQGLRAAVRDVSLPPLSFALSGLGHFPPRGEPRVVWAALGGDVAALSTLQEDLVARGERCGVPREKRPFVPHVTLGRVKSPFGALALVDALREVGGKLRDKPFAATSLTLYASELRPGGPIHTPLEQRTVPGAVTPDRD